MLGSWLGARTIPYTLAHHAVEHGARPALELDGRAVTYAQLGRGMEQVASRLKSDGVGGPEVVAVILPNCLEHVMVTLGVLRAGCTCMPCNPTFTAGELAYQLAHSGATTAIVAPESRALTEAALAVGPTQIRLVSCEPGSWASGTGLFRDDSAGGLPTDEPALPSATDPALILYTSGTTARPKGVVFTQGNLMQWSENLASAMRYSEQDRLLHCFPLYHGNGGVSLLYPVLLRAGTVVMVSKFSASRLEAQVRDLGITATALNASHIKMVLAHPPVPGAPQERLLRVQFSLALDAERRAEFERRCHARLIEVYGLTEGLGVSTANPVEGPRKPGSVGLPFPPYELAIQTSDGARLGSGQPGEILIRTNTEFGFPTGYFKDPDATRATYRDGWLHTGDVGYLDDDGYLYFVERSKDMIKRSGYSIAPRELETCIVDCAGVQESAVVGIPDDLREEAIVAFVVGEITDPALVAEYCRTQLAAYKQPQHVLILESLPLNAIGKVDKVELRRLAITMLETTS